MSLILQLHSLPTQMYRIRKTIVYSITNSLSPNFTTEISHLRIDPLICTFLEGFGICGGIVISTLPAFDNIGI